MPSGWSRTPVSGNAGNRRKTGGPSRANRAAGAATQKRNWIQRSRGSVVAACTVQGEQKSRRAFALCGIRRVQNRLLMNVPRPGLYRLAPASGGLRIKNAVPSKKQKRCCGADTAPDFRDGRADARSHNVRVHASVTSGGPPRRR